MRVGSFFPFQTTYYLNGHSFIEHQLKGANVGFRKDDNAFLAVDDVAALQAAADKFSPEIIRKRLDYWTFVLGPKFSAKERKQVKLSRTYAISQVEYCFNFVFKRNFPIHKLFERSCELGLWRLTAHKIAKVFGTRLQRNHRGKLSTVIDQIEHGHHVFRAYFRNAVLRQYEKFSMFLRNELCSNNLYDFGLKKGLDHLDEVRHKFQSIISRFAGFQAQWLNVHTDFPLLQRIALPLTVGAVRHPGIKIQDTRIIRLLEVLLHAGTQVGGWTTREIHQAILTTFHLSADTYSLNQLRYDLRKIKGHGLLERDGTRYAYLLTRKGVQVAFAVAVFPQATVRTARQQPLPPPAKPATSARQPPRTRVPPRRQSHRKDRRSSGGSLTRPPTSPHHRPRISSATRRLPRTPRPLHICQKIRRFHSHTPVLRSQS